jgi:hypothetical protein
MGVLKVLKVSELDSFVNMEGWTKHRNGVHIRMTYDYPLLLPSLSLFVLFVSLPCVLGKML